MPELPEVETVRRGLEPALEGRRIVAVALKGKGLRRPFPPQLAERLRGCKVLRLARRAKYLLAELDSGETLVLHLGMSGRIGVYTQGHDRKLGQYVYKPAPKNAGHGRHDHLAIETDAPARIVLTDPRRFGLVALIPTADLDKDKLFDGLGPEPLGRDFSPAVLRAALKGKKTPIKAALLDQRVVAGLGNIYVCEALFRAHISPRRLAGTLSGKRVGALHEAIRAVLEDALRAGGSSLRDFAAVDGNLGNFQHHFRVYDREGLACATKGCKGTVRRIVQSGRSTFYCPRCQT